MLLPTDPLFPYQSYLSGLAETAYDILPYSPVLRIEPIWEEFRGEGVLVGVAGAVDRFHPELIANYDPRYLDIYDPEDFVPTEESAALSTMYAGIVAADDNGTGIVGIAPDARVTAWDSSLDMEIDVAIGVVGSARTNTQSIDIERLLDGRGGNGSLLFATTPITKSQTPSSLLGDSYPGGVLNSEFEIANDRFVILTGALGASGRPTLGRDGGDATLVSAPVYTDTDFVASTALTMGLDARGDFGVSNSESSFGFWEILIESSAGNILPAEDYWSDATGIAGGAVAAGVGALMLEANPDISWRDAQDILAYSALRVGEEANVNPIDDDPRYFGYDYNGANTKNGHGLPFSLTFGFGEVDVYGAVRLAESWVPTVALEIEISRSIVNTPTIRTIPGDNYTSFEFTVPENIRVEHATVDIDFESPRSLLFGGADSLLVALVSPKDSLSFLTADTTFLEDGFVEEPRMEQTLLSRRFRGEEAQAGDGIWELRIYTDDFSSNTVTVHDLDITLHGAAVGPDDVYVFNDDFRRAIEDLGVPIIGNGGQDTANAAPVTEDLYLPASAGSTGTAGGDALYTVGTVPLMRLVAGDGNDRLEAAAVGTVLEGWRGDDTLIGGLGTDHLLGGVGNDVLSTGLGEDVILGKIADLMGDRITDFAAGDVIRVSGAEIGAGSLSLSSGSAILGFDLDGNDGVDGEITLDGDFSEAVFEVAYDKGDTLISIAASGAVKLSPAGERFITSDAQATRIYGDKGDDFILAGTGGDLVAGGAGSDVLLGSFGNDTIGGGIGNDEMTGGAGADTFAISAADFDGFGVDTITDFTPGEDTVVLSGFDETGFVDFASGIAIDTGVGGFIVLEGLAEEDLLTGDVVTGPALGFALASLADLHVLTDADDRFVTSEDIANTVRAGGGADSVLTADGNDRIDGEAGSDFLAGGAGDDTILGGAGNDILSGGPGADRFEFEAGETGFVNDTITDFAIGEDVVALLGYTAPDLLELLGSAAARLSATEFVVFEGVTLAALAAAEADVFVFG